MSVPGVTERFFADLGSSGYHPLMRRTTGKIKFELTAGQAGAGKRPAGRAGRWLVEINHGEVTVSRRNVAADATMRTDPDLFEQMVTGQQNLTAAVIRGAVSAEGDLDLLIQFQRVLPGPGHPAAFAGASAGAGVTEGRS